MRYTITLIFSFDFYKQNMNRVFFFWSKPPKSNYPNPSNTFKRQAIGCLVCAFPALWSLLMAFKCLFFLLLLLFLLPVQWCWEKLAVGIRWQQHPGRIWHPAFRVHSPQQTLWKPRVCPKGSQPSFHLIFIMQMTAPCVNTLSWTLSLLFKSFTLPSGDEYPEGAESSG